MESNIDGGDMTYQEAKELLEQIKSKRRLCIRIKDEINTLRESYDIIKSPLSNLTGGTHPCGISSVERLVMRVEEKRERFERTLQETMDLEDKLSEIINTLTPTEQNIIIGYYMQDKTHYELANQCNYCDKQIWRIKNKAIEKIARKL